MRHCTFAIIVGLVGRAAADPPDPMARIDAGNPACDLLHGWGSGGASCETVQTMVVRGLGKVVVWRAQTLGTETWVLTIQAGSDTWESPVISAPPGSDCSAGHCTATTTTQVLHVFHPNGRLAVALEVRIETRWYVNEPPRTQYRLETSSSFIACGSSTDGVRRCTTFDGQGCAVKLADNGTIARTCTDRVNFDGT